MRFCYSALAYIAVIAASYALPAESAETNLRAAAPMPVGGCSTEECYNQVQLRRLAESAAVEEERISFGWIDDMAAKLKGKTGAAGGAQTNDRLAAALAKANKAKQAKAATGAATTGYQRSPGLATALKKAEDQKWKRTVKKYGPDLQGVANSYKNNADKLTNTLMTRTDDLMNTLSKNSAFKKAENQVEKMVVNIAPDMASTQMKFRVKFQESYDDVAKNVKVGVDQLKKNSKEYQAMVLKNQDEALKALSGAQKKDETWLKQLEAFANKVKSSV
jgi:hypothetical protein